MAWIESPTNPTLRVVDIEEVCKIVRRNNPNAIIVVDNTFASSYAQVAILRLRYSTVQHGRVLLLRSQRGTVLLRYGTVA